MRFEVFGKTNCAKCQSTKKKLEHLTVKAGVRDAVDLTFVDMETVDGLADGAFYDVGEVPTVIVRSPEGRELARWEGRVPLSPEVQAFLASPRA
jgi:hypothetical protein